MSAWNSYRWLSAFSFVVKQARFAFSGKLGNGFRALSTAPSTASSRESYPGVSFREYSGVFFNRYLLICISSVNCYGWERGRAPVLWSKGRRFETRQVRLKNFWQCPLLGPSVRCPQMVWECVCVCACACACVCVCVCGRNELEVCTTLAYEPVPKGARRGPSIFWS